MTSQDQFKRFGAYLRAVRKECGYTLRQVAAASTNVVPHRDGQISQPYLSQIESGKDVVVSLAKLLTLAALYGRKPDEVIGEAPDAYRATLLSEWGQWRAAYRHEGTPHGYLPTVVAERDAAFDSLLALSAVDVRLPFGHEAGARRLIRWGMTALLMPAWLCSDSAASGFWSRGVELQSWSESSDYTWLWSTIFDDFKAWALYQCDAGERVAALVKTWSIETPNGANVSAEDAKLTCTLHDRELDSSFGVVAVPLAAVWAVRWRQAAHLLSATAPPGANLPKPPDPLDGLLDYITVMIQPDCLPVTHPAVGSRDLSRRLRALFSQIPAIDALGPRKSDLRAEVSTAAFFANAKPVHITPAHGR